MSEATGSSTTSETIYVYLVDEGTDVWRPTRGRRIGAQVYEVLATSNYDPAIETWQFVPGTLVQCEERVLRGDRVLVAVRAVDDFRGNSTMAPPQ